jgi:C-methyltransferase-like protein/putative zinc binding protein/methyltransferase family protein
VNPAPDPQPELTPRGVHVCRGCGAEPLESVLDLGVQPLANELLPGSSTPDAFFPLHLRICPTCGLGQVGEFVRPERIFGDYPYLSSVSSSWLEHAKAYAGAMNEELDLAGSGGLVVEVASNDGYLLREFADLGIPVLGVEPAANVADIARSRGVRTLTAFFGRDTAAAVVAEHGHPRLIAANNVMAHVPDLDDFVGGLALLCDQDTVVTVENPSFVTLLNETQFDTIYHEHFSYLSAHAVARAVARHGLALVGVEELTTHGGSYRYTIVPAGSRPVDPAVTATIERELAEGLLSPRTWADFAQRSRETITGLRTWLERRTSEGRVVAGYGAAAKGNTLLNAAGVGESDITAVADGSPEKQGRLMPGSRIPVVAPPLLAGTGATDVLILPWNIAPEIAPLVRDLLPGATCWVAVPEMRALAHAD